MVGLRQRLGRLLSRPGSKAVSPSHVYAMRLERGSGVAGSLVRLSPDGGDFAQSTINPFGGRVAYWGVHPRVTSRQIWVADIAEGHCRPVTRGPAVHGHPAWWPDGQTLVCFATESSDDWRPEAQFDITRPPSHLYRLGVDSTEVQQLTDGPWIDERPAVTPDGEAVIFVSNRAGTGLNLWALNVASGDLRQLTHGSKLDYRPAVAPDSKKIAHFTADEQGRHVLAVISWPAAAPVALSPREQFKWLHGPWWAADSRHLLVHALAERDARPTLWIVDSANGECRRMALPGVRDSSHGTWDDTQSWLAFDSRQPLRLQPPVITETRAP